MCFLYMYICENVCISVCFMCMCTCMCACFMYVCTCMYRKVPRISSPPLRHHRKKIVSRLNERIFVIMNAAACRSLKSCWSTIPFLKCGNRYAEALTITKIRSFKHEPFFFRWGLVCMCVFYVCLYMYMHMCINTYVYMYVLCVCFMYMCVHVYTIDRLK